MHGRIQFLSKSIAFNSPFPAHILHSLFYLPGGNRICISVFLQLPDFVAQFLLLSSPLGSFPLNSRRNLALESDSGTHLGIRDESRGPLEFLKQLTALVRRLRHAFGGPLKLCAKSFVFLGEFSAHAVHRCGYLSLQGNGCALLTFVQLASKLIVLCEKLGSFLFPGGAGTVSIGLVAGRPVPREGEGIFAVPQLPSKLVASRNKLGAFSFPERRSFHHAIERALKLLTIRVFQRPPLGSPLLSCE